MPYAGSTYLEGQGDKAHHVSKWIKDGKSRGIDYIRYTDGPHVFKNLYKRASMVCGFLEGCVTATEREYMDELNKFGHVIGLHLRRSEDGVLAGTGSVQYRFAHQLDRAKHRVTGFSMRQGGRICYVTDSHVEMDLNQMDDNVGHDYRCSLKLDKDVMERPGPRDLWTRIRYKGRENDYIQRSGEHK